MSLHVELLLRIAVATALGPAIGRRGERDQHVGPEPRGPAVHLPLVLRAAESQPGVVHVRIAPPS